MHNLDDDLEFWLLEAGDAILHKKADSGWESLTATELAIYHLWVIDYAVRNSGSLEPVADFEPDAVALLQRFAEKHNLTSLADWLKTTANEALFCDNYDASFTDACLQLKHFFNK